MSEHAHPSEKGHFGVRTYLTVAAVLALITLVEVGVFYVPSIHEGAFLAPILLTLSSTKFALVAMFYMHLKSDHRLFSAIFTIPLLIAVGVGVALLFLFGVFVSGGGA